MKIDTALIMTVLQQDNDTKENADRILDKILMLAEENKPEKQPRTKKRFAIIISDPDNHLQGKEFMGWAVQHPEDDFDMGDVPKLVEQAGINFRCDQRKGDPIKTVGEAFLEARNKDFADLDIFRKHREPAPVFVTNNKLPSMDLQAPPEDEQPTT